MEKVDIVIIGAGMAGASLGAVLAMDRNVALLEREEQPGYHTTGRSAAVFSEAYGNNVIRALSAASREFLVNPPAGFSDVPLVKEKGLLFIGRADQESLLDENLKMASEFADGIHRLNAEETRQLVPVLKEGYAAGAVMEPGALELDVNAIHMGYLRQMKQRGGQLFVDAEVTGLDRDDAAWIVVTPNQSFRAETVVNAAGAWIDKIAGIAGATAIGALPLRRTALTFSPDGAAAPEGMEKWPFVVDAEEEFYFKVEAGKILASPADESESGPCDAQPEELDIAIAVDRLQKATNFEIRIIERTWAGLRTFAPDRSPAVGFDAGVGGFFWFGGQGGYGIQTAPAMAAAAAGLILYGKMPTNLQALGIKEEDISPQRF